MDTVFAALPAAAAVSFLAFREAWRAWQPARHLLAGHYEEARASASTLAASWLRVIPGIRVSAEYAIAASLHLMGHLEEALEVIHRTDGTGLRPATRYDFDSLEAATLTLLDRDPTRVVSLLSSRADKPPEDRIVEALARDDTTPLPVKAPRGDRAAVFHYFRALYELRAGRDAEPDFRAAADSPHANVYTRRARAYLAPRPVAEDGPSSLAPQVVAKPAD